MKKVTALFLFASFSLQLLHGANVHAASSVRVWLQVMDSCRQALPGANFTLIDPSGSSVDMGPSPGKRRVTVSPGSCPVRRGNCQEVPTGCLSWDIEPPVSGTATYRIVEKSTWDASDGFCEILQGQQASQGLFPVMVGVLVAIKPQHLQWMLQGLSEGLRPIFIPTMQKRYIHPEAYLLALRSILLSFTIFSLAMEVAMVITTLMIILQGHQAAIVLRTTIDSADWWSCFSSQAKEKQLFLF